MSYFKIHRGETVTILVGYILLISIPASAQQNEAFKTKLREAQEFYDRARYGSSLSLLDRHTTDPITGFLIGRDYYMLGDFKKATKYLKKAVMSAPENSQYVDWLGRAYRERVDTSNPLSAAILMKEAQKTFKLAVRLNPTNVEALSDLFNYCLDAPAVLGGGYERAESIAEKMSAVDPYQASWQRWEIAQRRHEHRIGAP
jgi:tetratricopeptide (TPR) repeat protein